jgi:hypothetical protein
MIMLKKTSVFMKSSIFWDITPFIPFKFNWLFGENVASIFRVEE